MLETVDLTKTFGDLVAVDGLDLRVERGEVFGLLGPNGSGKSTTMRMLIDAIRPTRGSATIDGVPVGEPALRRRVGYMPGDLRLPARYSAQELFDFWGALRGGADPSVEADLVARFELDPTRPIRELSTGNRRKVGLIAAFHHSPELLILDEPTAGLDPLLQQVFVELVRERQADGATTFLSSHVIPEVEQVADRVAILRHGQLVTVGTLDELEYTGRVRIDLHVREGSVAAFDGVAGVVEAGEDGSVIRLVVEGPVDAVIKAAAHLDVDRIVTHEPDLEDAFFEFYAEPEP
jgi:ABC-2 type transport system ATP-binding protein